MLLFSVKVFGHFPPSSVVLLKKLCPALTVVAATVMKVPDGQGSACNRTRPVRVSPPPRTVTLRTLQSVTCWASEMHLLV